MKTILSILAAALLFVGCATQTKKGDEGNDKKSLVLYYSQTGATKTVAEEIQKQLGADIATIDIENPYDGDFQQTIARCQDEKANGILPKVKPLNVNIEDYDIIFLGYPIWFGSYAPPVEALIKDNDFAGKEIVPFCTFGSGGLNTSTEALKSALPNATIHDGYGVRNERLAAAPEEINRFLIENGYKEGEITPLPDYSQLKDVTDKEIAIFNEACADYQFPLGTPVSFGSRMTENSTDYMFVALNNDKPGLQSSSIIYVTVVNGEKAVFTQVVR